MIIAVSSRKGSPGVTSITAWLALFWSEPGVTRLVVEADPSGGTLAARWQAAHRLSWDPGLLSLSTTRTPLTVPGLEPLTQRLADQLLVAAAPPAPDQVAGGLTRWGDRGPSELAALPGVRAFVDCGRLSASSPALALARRAALTVIVCRPRLDEVNALFPAVAELSAAGCTTGLVCVGHEPYPPAEIAATAGLPLLGVLPVDVRAAATFDRDGIHSGRAFRRSALAQTAAELTEVVRARCASLLGGPDANPARFEPGRWPAPPTHPSAPEAPPGSSPAAAPTMPVSPAIAAARAAGHEMVPHPGPGGAVDPEPPARPEQAS